MRCKNCNVDLGESYERCPLCGEKASDEAAVLEGFETAEYPEYDEKTAYIKPKISCAFPQKYLLRAVLPLCGVFGVIALFGAKPLWNVGVPLLFAATSAAYFVVGLFEKGRLLHSMVSLLSTLLSAGVFTLIALIAKSGVTAMLDSLALCLGFFLLLWIIKPQRATAQMKALFVL